MIQQYFIKVNERKGKLIMMKKTMKNNGKKIIALAMAAAMTAGLTGSVTVMAKGSESASGLEEVTLTWYIPGNGPQADTEKVEEAIYEYLKDDLNVRLDFVECDWGSYDDKVQMAIASQEPFDFCYTAHWSNNFYNNISKNAFLELEDLLDEYAPTLKENVPEAGWNASTVNGHIYGVPNVQAWVYQGFVSVRDDILEKYNFNLSTVKELKDLDPLFEQIKADDPSVYPIVNCGNADILNSFQNTLNFEELTGSKIPGVLQYGDEEFKVVNQWELPQVQEFLQLMYDWNQKGYFKSDSATLTDYIPELTSGRSVAKVGATYSPASQASEERNYGQPVTIQKFGTPHISTSSIVAALTAISRTSEHPDRAIQFLERVNTDPTLYNLICFGIEGQHYTKEGNVVTTVENSGYDPNQDWVYGNQFNAYVRAGQPDDIWDLMNANNDAAEPSPILGFAFDSTPVQTELASVSAVVDEYYLSLSTGSVNPEEKLPEFIEKMEKAGSQAIIDECQKQLDEWIAANK